MNCVLCHQPVDLLTLDAEGYGGMPAHESCAEGHRQALRDALDSANAMVLAEPDPARHRNHRRPPAVAA